MKKGKGSGNLNASSNCHHFCELVVEAGDLYYLKQGHLRIIEDYCQLLS